MRRRSPNRRESTHVLADERTAPIRKRGRAALGRQGAGDSEEAPATTAAIVRALDPGAGVPPAIVQFMGRKRGSRSASEERAIAERGFSGATTSLPFRAEIQMFLGVDLSQVKAFVGGPAAEANQDLGSRAYASDGRIAFREAPDLRTVAHEATHLVQQQRLGFDESSRAALERHADAVADHVVRGESAAHLIPGSVGSERNEAGGAIQFIENEEEPGQSPSVGTLEEFRAAMRAEAHLRLSQSEAELSAVLARYGTTLDGCLAGGPEVDEHWERIEHAAQYDRELKSRENHLASFAASRRQELSTRQGKWMIHQPPEEQARILADVRVAEGRLEAMRHLRASVLAAHPELALLGSSKVSASEISGDRSADQEQMAVRAREIVAAIGDVRQRLDRNDMPLSRLGPVLRATMQRCGVTESARDEGDPLSVEVFDWVAREERRDFWIKVGSAVVTGGLGLLAVGCLFVPGGWAGTAAIVGAIAGGTGSAIGAASAAYNHEQADDLAAAARTGADLDDGAEARKDELFWAQVDMALTVIDAVTCLADLAKLGRLGKAISPGPRPATAAAAARTQPRRILRPGERVTAEDLGMPQRHLQAFRELAGDRYDIYVRFTNPEAMDLLDARRAVPKPMEIKSKTIGAEDIHLAHILSDELGVRSWRTQDAGKVGMWDEAWGSPQQRIGQLRERLEETTDPKRRAALERALGRLETRGQEFIGVAPKLRDMRANGQVDLRSGILHNGAGEGALVQDDWARGLPMAADHDVYVIVDRQTGRPADYETHTRITGALRDYGVMHNAHGVWYQSHLLDGVDYVPEVDLAIEMQLAERGATARDNQTGELLGTGEGGLLGRISGDGATAAQNPYRVRSGRNTPSER